MIENREIMMRMFPELFQSLNIEQLIVTLLFSRYLEKFSSKKM